jgi:hypothetical protein
MNTDTSPQNSDKWTVKEFLVALPVLGSALAITFDVGYFTALDINYFNIFSISEHITFALEVLPTALGISILTIVVPMTAQYGRDHARAHAEKERQIGKSIPFYKQGIFWFTVVWLIWNLFLIWRWPSYFLGVIAVAFVIAIALTTLIPKYFIRPPVLAATAIVVSLGVAFAIGLDAAISYRKSVVFPSAVTTVDGEMKAKIVRSGERGLLFYEESSNRLVLLPWREIKRVTTVPH